MAGAAHNSAYWTTVVCIDRCGGGELAGRLYNPYWSEGRLFSGTLGFLSEMEDLLNETQQPQSFTAIRRFGAGEEPRSRPAARWRPPKGERATFSVRVLFRQNATWQGRVEWLEGKREEAFRSVLELLMLIGSATEQLEKEPEKGTLFSASL